MKFSRNPVNGLLEAYTDEGVYKGHVFTMGDLVTSKKETAQDGGPGSGNFGHKGRPGLVGGSGPGGGKGSGKLYRHEKQGVGFFGTRRDWLNGLEGEEQHKAARFIAEKKRDMKEAFKKAETIKDLYLKGYLTLDEREKREKELGVYGLAEKSPVEQFILQKGDKMDVHTLLSYADNARNWPENGKELKNHNLTEEEQKLFDYTWNKEEFKPIFSNLHAKALGLPADKIDIPEELYYESGARERPKPPKGEPNYDWYKEKRNHTYASIEANMGDAIGDPMWGVRWTGEDVDKFQNLNKRFLDAVKYDRTSPRKLRSALSAISNIMSVQSAEKDKDINTWIPQDDFKPTEEMIANLSEEEKNRLKFLANAIAGNGFSPVDRFEKVEDITKADYLVIGRSLSAMALRTKEEQDRVRDYVLIMDKMLTGESPSENNPYKAEKDLEKEREKEKENARIAQRDKEQEEFRNSPKAAQKKDRIKRIKDTTPDKIKSMTRAELEKFFYENISCSEVANASFVTSPLIDDEFYNTAVLAMRNVIEKFPFLAGEIGGFGDHSSGGIAGWSIYAGENKSGKNTGSTEIVLNYDEFKDLQRLANKRKEKTETKKWFVPVDDGLPPGYADICHEMGHALAGWLERYIYGKINVTVTRAWLSDDVFVEDKVSDKLKNGVMKALGISTFDEIVEEVSKYGASSHKNKEPGQPKNNSNSSEFFAECFCELMCSSHPRRAAVEFGKQLNELIKKYKINEMNTSRTPSTKPNVIITYK